MNVKRISLALGALALLSTGSAFAAGVSANVGPIGASIGANSLGAGAGINVGPLGVGAGLGLNNGYLGNTLTYPAVVGGNNVLTYPGVVGNACANPCATRTGLLGGLFNRNRTWFDLSAFGTGVKLGGPGPDFYGPSYLGANAMIYPSSLTAASGCGLNTFSAVIPNTTMVGGGMGVGGERIGNPWLDLHLWKFGLSAGRVNPAYDMRPAGDI